MTCRSLLAFAPDAQPGYFSMSDTEEVRRFAHGLEAIMYPSRVIRASGPK
jgi:hypothetical protein